MENNCLDRWLPYLVVAVFLLAVAVGIWVGHVTASPLT